MKILIEFEGDFDPQVVNDLDNALIWYPGFVSLEVLDEA